MRQRVGIARALVVDPDVLLMDEAFSALDVLTGERLRDDILELWEKEQISTKAILVVSHNIEEAIMMADRVLIFASDPGRVRYEMRVDLPRPRDADSEDVKTLVDEIYAVMTAGRVRTGKAVEAIRLDERLPQADISLMEGLLEKLMDEPFMGHADLPQLGEETELTDEELLPAAEALALLEFALLAGGDMAVTELGRRYVAAEYDERQQLFARQLLKRVPLAAHIHHSLQQESAGGLKEEHFLALLRESLTTEEAERVLKVAIEWGRHGEVYRYNYNTGMIQLPEADSAPSK
jgi:NitT/TauT family transport system ATP-binding protein